MRSALSRSRPIVLLAVAASLAAATLVVAEPTSLAPRDPEPGPLDRGEPLPRTSSGADNNRQAAPRPAIEWRDSVAAGSPAAGSLARGVRLPASGRSFFTWDPVQRERRNRGWRRWGTDDLVRTVLGVLRDFHRARPAAPRIGVGDLSRPRGGDFGPRYGFIGHATHQNGLDADVYYPRLDRRERPPERPDQVDLELSQDLVDRFLAAGAERIYVGPSTSLTGPPEVVQQVVNHDNHLHVRIPNPGP